ncbi:MAG: metal-dependent hydrolase [Sphingomonadaceae bacterium]|nr:metal-dependent hydrolase [Sphingomonadaceae bacterium]
MAKDVTPVDLTITPRDRRFGREIRHNRWWHGGNPFATAFYNALSVTFPKGEAFFVESVKAHRDGLPPKLANEVRAFVQQEVMHSREHIAFNRHVADHGYDVDRLERDVQAQIDLTKGRPLIASLAATMCVEHFTAIMASEILSNPRHFAGADEEAAAMWRWHALEEIEHKGVAYDVWLHATRSWPRLKRWKVKAQVMLLTTQRFFYYRTVGMLELLRQDGITGPKAWWGLFRYALVRPGMYRKIAVEWLKFFMPGFHPWNHDDRDLIRLAESEYEAAVMPGARKALAA